jgi:C-5 cytosine-specific DNA methylase
MIKPLCIDLFCGLGGWAEGFLAEGYDVVGFDVERHRYWVPENADGAGYKGTRPVEKRGWTQGCAVSLGMEGPTARPATRLLEYPGQLVLQDVLTLDGQQFRNAAVIVASPPCQAYSYRAMPWKRAKALPPPNNELFEACFRIAREAGVPIVIENVRGAQPWVGRAKWHYGSYYLWGDVPALMPSARQLKVPGFNFHQHENGQPGGSFQSAAVNGMKSIQDGLGGYGGSFGWNNTPMRRGNSKPSGRKTASAQIAKIPFPLAQWIARVFRP